VAVDFTSNNLSDQHCYQFDWGTAAYCDTYYIWICGMNVKCVSSR
jgi:hypothetical protein